MEVAMANARVYLLLILVIVVAAVARFVPRDRLTAQAKTSPPVAIFLGPGEGRRIGTPPNDFLFRVGGGESGSTFEFAEATIKPNGGPPLHVHDDLDEAFYVVSGMFRVKVGDRLFDAPPGSFVFAPHGLPHAFVNTGTTEGTFVVIDSPPTFEAFWRETSDALRRLPPNSANIPKVLGSISEKYKMRVVGPPLSESPPKNVK
jgi:mannose-6-phosphate isomerase-like protein (cupin superfamily)